MTERQDVIKFRASDLAGPLKERADAIWHSKSLVAKRDLERYYSLLERTLPTLGLSKEEVCLVADSLNGTLIEPHTLSLVWANVDDSIRLDGLDEKWGVDGEALVGKLRAFTPLQATALVDAVERFWIGPNPMDEALIRVGLLKQ